MKYYDRKELLNLKGQILRADKTGFCRLGHIRIENYVVCNNKLCIICMYVHNKI